MSAGIEPGAQLRIKLAGKNTDSLDVKAFLELILNTKPPRIYAESEVRGDGSDWTLMELRLLGDISIAVPVTVYDNGLHNAPRVHEDPFQATLLYTPGALLRNERGGIPADWDEVTQNGEIDPEGYYQLYERRLLPPLIYASEKAGELGKKAFVTIPGIGCGQFAGPFRGQLEEHLKNTLHRLLKTHSKRLPDLRTLYYDPYRACQNERSEIDHIAYLVRPLTQGNKDKSQLCLPTHYQEVVDDFSECILYSIVAWDHVSWPGNDFYGGMRATDDGVKAAATDSMWKMTGVEGQYDYIQNKYQPLSHQYTWGEVVKENKIKLIVADNLYIYP